MRQFHCSRCVWRCWQCLLALTLPLGRTDIHRLWVNVSYWGGSLWCWNIEQWLWSWLSPRWHVCWHCIVRGSCGDEARFIASDEHGSVLELCMGNHRGREVWSDELTWVDQSQVIPFHFPEHQWVPMHCPHGRGKTMMLLRLGWTQTATRMATSQLHILLRLGKFNTSSSNQNGKTTGTAEA